jgi:multidrug transporter EmrE-like cation transporter
MTIRGMTLVAASAILTATANLTLRSGVLRYGKFSLNDLSEGLVGLAKQPLFVFGVVCYALAAIVWFGAISVENLSTSYPVLVGATFVLVATGAALVFQETISWQKLIGMTMILSGIVLVARA